MSARCAKPILSKALGIHVRPVNIMWKTGSQIVRAQYLVRFEGEDLDGEFA